MKKKLKEEEMNDAAPAQETMRNFVQVPPMPKPIPAPKAKDATAVPAIPGTKGQL
jgi:hypothetical protein